MGTIFSVIGIALVFVTTGLHAEHEATPTSGGRRPLAPSADTGAALDVARLNKLVVKFPCDPQNAAPEADSYMGYCFQRQARRSPESSKAVSEADLATAIWKGGPNAMSLKGGTTRITGFDDQGRLLHSEPEELSLVSLYGPSPLRLDPESGCWTASSHLHQDGRTDPKTAGLVVDISSKTKFHQGKTPEGKPFLITRTFTTQRSVSTKTVMTFAGAPDVPYYDHEVPGQELVTEVFCLYQKP